MCVMNVCQRCCAGISCMCCWTGENSAFLIEQKVGQEVKPVDKLTAFVDHLVNAACTRVFLLIA